MADLFHESVPDEWIDRVFAVMALCPQHRFQVLTKRSARMREYLTAFAGRAEEFGKALAAVVRSARLPFQAGIETIDDMLWPLPNVWPGVSVEDQQRADERIPDLLATPAAVRWLSCEPLLGPVDLTRIHEVFDGGLGCSWESCLNGRRFDVWGEGEIDGCTKIDWVIAGGESGPAARPMHPEWARGLRDQCAAAGVPFFFKQWGEWVFESQLFGDPDEGIFDASGTPRPGRSYLWPGEGEWMSFKVGKKRAGRLLDGVEHNGMPA
jgi:protein gp37